MKTPQTEDDELLNSTREIMNDLFLDHSLKERPDFKEAFNKKALDLGYSNEQIEEMLRLLRKDP